MKLQKQSNRLGFLLYDDKTANANDPVENSRDRFFIYVYGACVSVPRFVSVQVP